MTWWWTLGALAWAGAAVGADAASTIWALHEGAREANPLVRRIGLVVAVLLRLAACAAVAWYGLRSPGPWPAAGLFGLGTLTWWAAARNSRIAVRLDRRPRR